MYKLLILLLAMTIAVTLSTLPSFGAGNPGYQCRNIGKQKVKPYKFKKNFKAKPAPVAYQAQPKFRSSTFAYSLNE